MDAPPLNRIWEEPRRPPGASSRPVPTADPATRVGPRRLSRDPIVDAFCRVGPYRTRNRGRPYDFDDLLAEHDRFGIRSRLCLHAEARDGVPEKAMPRWPG